jgi:hypothetical protein
MMLVCPSGSVSLLSTNDDMTFASLFCVFPALRRIHNTSHLGFLLAQADNDGHTPLCVGSYYGHFGVVNALVDAGVDMSCGNSDGVTGGLGLGLGFGLRVR